MSVLLKGLKINLIYNCTKVSRINQKHYIRYLFTYDIINDRRLNHDYFMINQLNIRCDRFDRITRKMSHISLLNSNENISMFSLNSMNSLTLMQKRYKKGKGKAPSRDEREEKSDDEDDDEPEDDDFDSIDGPRDYIDMPKTMPSLRLDVMGKTGFGLARAKVEEIFYDNRLRLNNERVGKKSVETREGDTVDLILGFNMDDNDLIDIIRVLVKSVEDKSTSTGRAKVVLRKFKLTIPNYPDPYTGYLINTPSKKV